MRFDTPTHRITVFFLSALLWASLAAGTEVPRETLERLAEIRVEQARIDHLDHIGKITTGEHTRRTEALSKESGSLWEPFKNSPSPEAETTIEGLTRAKLALLMPQWEKERQALRKEREEREKQTAVALEEDARRAVEFQRQRMLLQGQLDSGAITQDSYAQKDRAALSGIADLRKKYETAGGMWPEKFDHRLELLTKALADNPGTALPQSQVREEARQGRGTPDFGQDVKLAAEIFVKEQENLFRFQRQLVPSDTYRETAVVYDRDLHRLRARYQAVSPKRGEEFQNAYANMAAPAIHALKVKYFPGKYAPVAPTKAATHTTTAHPAAAPSDTREPWRDYVFWGLLGLIGLGVVALIGHMTKQPEPEPKQEPQPPPLSDNYGSASYAALEMVPRSPDATARGVFLGKSSSPGYADRWPGGPGAPVVTTESRHTFIVAQTRTGKGTRVIVPTLLRYANSMFVIDPKGENTAVTARVRANILKQTVHILNPWQVEDQLFNSYGFQPASYNPLDAIDRNDPNAVSTARRLASAISPVIGRGDSLFWQQSSADILGAVFLWLADQEGLPRADDPTQKEIKTLARARQIVTRGRKSLSDQFFTKMAVSAAYDGALQEMIGDFIEMADETYTGIKGNLNTATQFISDPQIKRATNASSFSMDDLHQQPTTLYLVIPPKQVPLQRAWLRLVIAAATNSFQSAGMPKHRCMMLIDEFPALEKLQDLPTDIATMAGHGLDFTLIVQSIAQLKSIYKTDSDTILGNCAYKWYCNVTDLESAKYLSDSLGQATVRTTGTSSTSGSSSSVTGENSSSSSSSSQSTTYGEMGRKLLNPDEIMHLGKHVAIVMQPEGLPMYVFPVDYRHLTDAFAPFQQSYPALFWQPPISYDPNPFLNKSGNRRGA